MADHLDAPGLMSPGGDPRIDITDVYAFQKPGDPHKSILILNVNPLAPTRANEFAHHARYEILIDTNGDAKPDITFRTTFSDKVGDHQTARVQRVVAERDSDDGEHETENDAELVVEDAPVSFGSDVKITEGDDGFRFYAGLRSDPFFFDLIAFLHGLAFCVPGQINDFFIDKNVFGIVLEVPNRALGSNSNIGVWAHTLGRDMIFPKHFSQVDHMGRPAINTVFNHLTDKTLFNMTQPDQMRSTVTMTGKTFLGNFEDTLLALGGYDAAHAEAIAKILLPDILTFDYASSAGFLNGRKLQDDVIDISLGLVSNGKVPSDCVGPHSDYLSEFPYLGQPHV